MNKKQLSEICNTFSLGELLSDAIPVSGGLIHRMWRINTRKGSFALKELDSEIMKRPNIQNFYIQSEKIAAALMEKNVPLVTALINNESPLCETDGSVVMVFSWVEGKVLKGDQVSTEHAHRIGKTLATLHLANIKNFIVPLPETHLGSEKDWEFLVLEALNNKLSWSIDAKRMLPNLIDWSNAYQNAKQHLNENLVISHRDMDQKNVIWRDDIFPVLIDWESAGLINPTEELVAIAIEWSGLNEPQCKEDIFLSVVEGYRYGGAHIIKKYIHDAIYAVIGNYLNWLEFNMRRSIDRFKDNDSSRGATEFQIELTLKKLEFLAKNISYFYDLFS